MEISNAENIKQVKSILKNAHRVLILTGAGISAESGVPTFRGGGGAPVWRGMPFEQLSSAEMVEKDLPLVWEWFDYRRGKVSECEPNAAHKTLAKVQQSNHFEEFVIVTQNIDGLHQAAGAKSVIELHGSIWQARCLSCKTKQDLRDIPADERPPVCPECFDSMRLDVILFGEAMPMDAVYAAQEKAENCDICLVVGTSSLVYPAAELPLIAKQSGAKIIEINPEETSLSAIADISLRGKAGEILPLIFAEDNPENPRLPDDAAIKNSVEQSRKESKSEDDLKTSVPEVSSANKDPKNNLMNSQSHPLRVDFITSEQFPQLQKLGILTVSGQIDWERDLEDGLDHLEDTYGESTLVVLDVNNALTSSQVKDLEWECLIRFPYVFCSLECAVVPSSLKKFAMCISEIVVSLINNKDDKKTIIYSVGSPSISGLTAACTIAAASEGEIDSARAIEIVRAARRDAIESGEQERFVSLFGEYWKIYHKNLRDFYQQKNAVSEQVLSYGWSGDGVSIHRYKAPDGEWNFLNVFLPMGGGTVSDAAIEYDPDKTPFWNTELFGSLTEALQSMSEEELIFAAHPGFIHHDYREEVKNYLANLHANLTGEQREMLRSLGDSHLVTPEKWFEKADMFTRTTAESDALANSAQDRNNRNSTELSDKHFLLCWKEQSVLTAQNSPHPLDVVSSRQLNRVNAGDTIWIVTVNQDGELILAGRLKAAEVVDYLTAVRRLHDANLWDGDYYALAAEDTAEEINLINLGERVLELRFKKSGSDRLTATNGKIRAQQLGSMRELTAESALLLTEIWENAVFDFGDKDFDDKDFDDKDFDDEDFDGEAFSDDESDDDYNFPDAADVEIFEDIARREPLNAEAHYNVGVVCGQTGDPEGARQAYRRAVELDPNYFAAWYNLGADHLDTGEWREGVECFDKAIAAKPDFAIAHFMKGASYDRLDNHEEAIRSTRKGLEFSPDDAQAYHNIGYSYQRLGEYEKAIKSFEKALQLAPDDAQTFYKLGKCYRELGEREKEFDAYRKAIEIASDFIDALFALGTVYAHLTETAEGERVTYFETGGELILNDARVFFYMGLGNLALGNAEVAREGQAKLREMDALLADRLQFFIDRRTSVDESESDEESENKNLDFSEQKESQSQIAASKKRELIKIFIDGRSFEAKNIPQLYKAVLQYLVDTGKLKNVSIPVATGDKRYLLAKEAVHPTGKSFLAPVECGGFFMEAHNNRTAAIAQLKRLVKSLQVDFEFSEDEIVSAGSRPGVDKPVAQVTTQKSNEERFLGCLLGMAIGDALGTTAEFMSPGSFPEITSISGGGPFGLNPGEWTDDTSMALCLADSLIECGEFNPVDQMQRYCRWKNEGYLSSNGSAFDIGLTVRTALENFERQSEEELNPFCGSTSPSKAGNGSLMRLAPVVLFYANDAKRAISFAAESSRTTHGAREAVDACRYFAALITGALQGKSKEELLSAYFTPVKDLWETEPLSPKIAEIARGSFKDRKPLQIIGSSQGYVVLSLHAALWAFYHTDSFKDGALKVVNLGYDADTYGAIYGQLAGAFYGKDAIPADWLDVLAKKDLIASFARKLCEVNADNINTE